MIMLRQSLRHCSFCLRRACLDSTYAIGLRKLTRLRVSLTQASYDITPSTHIKGGFGRCSIEFCFETSLNKQVHTAHWHPNNQEILHRKTNPCKSKPHHYPNKGVHNQQQNTPRLQKGSEANICRTVLTAINTIGINHHGHKNNWYIFRPYQQNKRAFANKLPSLQPSINTPFVNRSYMDKPTEN